LGGLSATDVSTGTRSARAQYALALLANFTGTETVTTPLAINVASRLMLLPPALPPLGAEQDDPGLALQVHGPLKVTPLGRASAIVALVAVLGPAFLTLIT
jgi:hypothetical protein